MKRLNQAVSATFVALILAPTAVLADFPEPSTYATFMPSAVQRSAMSDETVTACLRSAQSNPDNLAPQIVCHVTHIARLDERLRVSIRNQMPRARSRALTRFTTSQREWVATRAQVCQAKWRTELNQASNSFGLAVSKCVVEETYRRAAWIESVVR
jgi:uncharacterized protein YecT (DUF1311 family)